ncbi:pleckstrin homology domain-containing family G member 4B-like isoform X2 [Ambystoma mexicanum]|uniref:pleckstrin homology domain-containing family G member 4B-like isoform X2 n=1 Tax=Ambystoma mexicanum TaxID=8296 RepID=UPI0037E72DC0
MDSESLDGCLQSTLAALYPPFEATAATVLCHVFDVVEKTYRGDGLRYLIDFLIPAKHILQCIQQDSCFQYCGLLFRHEGWPLCIHEKIVVQLASIDWRSLEPGDFYLQVVPYLKKTPRIVVKCLANDGHSIEEVVVPEISYTSIFTPEWLDAINEERMGTCLENCLLTTDEKLFRVPWEKVVQPEFIDKPKMIESTTDLDNHNDETSGISFPDTRSEQFQCQSLDMVDFNIQENEILEEVSLTDRTNLMASEAIVNDLNMCSQSKSNYGQEGEYVDIADISLSTFGPQVGFLSQSIAPDHKRHKVSENCVASEKHRLVVIRDNMTCSKNMASSEMLLDVDETGIRNYTAYETSEKLQYWDCGKLAGYENCLQELPTELQDSDYTTHSEFLCQTSITIPCGMDYSSFNEQVKREKEVAESQHEGYYNSSQTTDSLSDITVPEIISEMDPKIMVSKLQACKEILKLGTDVLECCSGHSRIMDGHELSGSDSIQPESPVEGGLSLSPARHFLSHCGQCVDDFGISREGLGQCAGDSGIFCEVHEQCSCDTSISCKALTHSVAESPVSCEVFMHCAGHYGNSSEVLGDHSESKKMVPAEPCLDVIGFHLLQEILNPSPTQHDDDCLQVLSLSEDGSCASVILSQGQLSSVEEEENLLNQPVELENQMAVKSTTAEPDCLLLSETSIPRCKSESSSGAAECVGGKSAYLPSDDNHFVIEDVNNEGREYKAIVDTCMQPTEERHEECCRITKTPSVEMRTPDEEVQNKSRTELHATRACEPERTTMTPLDNIIVGLSNEGLVHPSTVEVQVECSKGSDDVRGEDPDVAGTLCEIGFLKDKDQSPCLGMLELSEPTMSFVDNIPMQCASARVDTPGPNKLFVQDSSVSQADTVTEAPLSPDSQEIQTTDDGLSRNLVLQVDRLEKSPRQEFMPLLTRRLQTPPTHVQDVNSEVLASGVCCLPGTRDRSGRAIVLISTRNTIWLNPHCNTTELFRLFLYFHSLPRPECQALGLIIVVDARRCSPVPSLFKAFNILQDALPNCIHSVLLLGEKDLTFRVEKPTAMQFELLTSVKALHKHIDCTQLPLDMGGTFPYCHRDWLSFRLRLENLQQGCEGACSLLQSAIEPLKYAALPEKAADAGRLLAKYGKLMKNVLDDTRLVKLQLEGGALLSRLKKEESCVTLTNDYRDAIQVVTVLYNQVDEQVHHLVMLSNKRIQELELVIEFEAFEASFQEIICWVEQVGHKRLQEMQVLDESLERLLQAQRDFREFDRVACDYCKRGQEAIKQMERWDDVSFGELLTCQVKMQTYKRQLGEFRSRLEETRSQIEKTVILYQFFDKAYKWALEGMRHLACVSMEDCHSLESAGAVVQCLEAYREQHPEIGEARFLEMKELACALGSDGGAKHWKFAWSKCQETKRVFEKKMEAALRARSAGLCEPPACDGEKTTTALRGPVLAQRRYSDGMEPRQHYERNNSVPYFHSKAIHSPAWRREKCLAQSPNRQGELSRAGQDPRTAPTSSPFSSGVSGSLLASALRRLSLSSVSDEEPTLEVSRVDLLHPSVSASSTPDAQRPFQKRALRKAQSFDIPGCESARYGCQRTLSEPARRGNTGVFIKGLEVSSTEVADRNCLARHSAVPDWAVDCLPEMRRTNSTSLESRICGSKLRHIIDEMVTTEREYVRSLSYIINCYFPEMERLDLPQDLRGKRSVIFGNLEKLYDFHSQYFLRELESCCNHPLRASHCFLRHQDQFGMYALYSKNKPKSDALLASHGNSFFKVKQMQLGDKMDLASYLLKPIQRMSKYALLLKDLIKECDEAQEQELCYLRAAQEMVKFQLRHGNDLLAMDAIRDCDVNLKEQGQLVRQDEFTIWLGRKKCQRHVFLFEDLILFSKPKRLEGGLDVYMYKRSFKTADIGLTENSGESGLRFEIWFRRRKSNDTYVLQASTLETKQAWTCDVAQILWQQATRNKEIRMQEMVSMGVGNKPFMDIKPSDAAINDRAIDYIMKGRGARTRASIAVSLFDHSNPYKRTQTPISTSSTPSICAPSSASLLGPLNLHVYVNQGVMASTRPFSTSTCIEEDELEHDTSSQPSMTTESSESSQCISGSGSSGSDSGCVSSIPQESLSEDACSPCDTAYTLSDARHISSRLSLTEDKPRFLNRQYISSV